MKQTITALMLMLSTLGFSAGPALASGKFRGHFGGRSHSRSFGHGFHHSHHFHHHHHFPHHHFRHFGVFYYSPFFYRTVIVPFDYCGVGWAHGPWFWNGWQWVWGPGNWACR